MQSTLDGKMVWWHCQPKLMKPQNTSRVLYQGRNLILRRNMLFYKSGQELNDTSVLHTEPMALHSRPLLCQHMLSDRLNNFSGVIPMVFLLHILTVSSQGSMAHLWILRGLVLILCMSYCLLWEMWYGFRSYKKGKDGSQLPTYLEGQLLFNLLQGLRSLRKPQVKVSRRGQGYQMNQLDRSDHLKEEVRDMCYMGNIYTIWRIVRHSYCRT